MSADDQHDEARLKAQLYRQVVQRSPPELLIERMRLYGFWPDDQPLPPDPPEEVDERAELQQQIDALRQQWAVVNNPDKALAEERKRRWQASKQRRAEAKAARAAKAEQRRQAWQQQRRQSIVHAGFGVSAGLSNNNSDHQALAALGAPVLDDAPALAAALELELGILRWLTFHRRGASVVHYHRYQVPKKTGGQRHISAPKPQLAKAQRWVLEEILAKLPNHDAAHGFIAGRSIVSNAAPHAAKAVVINMDLENFFPSITWPRVKGIFQRLGYSEQVATLLALLCTEPPRVEAKLNRQCYYVAVGERALPQGACTSPALSNRLCAKLDRRLMGMAAALGFAYSRYADDLSFSSDNHQRVGQLLSGVRMILRAEGLVENSAKTRVMRRGGRQEVTGLTVNHSPRVSRTQRRELRAILHNAARHGLESQNRDQRSDFAGYLRGRVAFVGMVEPQRAGYWQGLLVKALAA